MSTHNNIIIDYKHLLHLGCSTSVHPLEVHEGRSVEDSSRWSLHMYVATLPLSSELL